MWLPLSFSLVLCVPVDLVGLVFGGVPEEFSVRRFDMIL